MRDQGEQKGFLLLGAIMITLVAALLSMAMLERVVIQQRIVTGQSEQLQNSALVNATLTIAKQTVTQESVYPSACGQLPCDNDFLLHALPVNWHQTSANSAYTIQTVAQLTQPGFSDIMIEQITARAGSQQVPNQWVCQLYWAQAVSAKLPVLADVELGVQSERCFV